MDEIFGGQKTAQAQHQFILATVDNASSSGTLIRFDDGTTSLARYKRIVTGQTLSAGDRVLVASISGSFVIIGKISN